MRLKLVVVSAVLIAASSTLVAGMAGSARQAAPAVNGITDVKVETLGKGLSSAAPGYTLLLSRLTFAPGGSIALHTHPGDAVFFVQSGTITWVTGEGAPLLTRAADAAAIAAGTPTPPETLAVGQEVTLEAGDTVFYDGMTSHEVRNGGTEEAIVLYSGLRQSDQPGISFIEATPAP